MIRGWNRLFLWIVLGTTGPLIVHAQVLERDSLDLVALYNATDGPAWTNNTNWLAGPVDSWWGVEVTDERVSSVILPDNKLTGQIPSEAGRLTFLNVLDLSSNSLSGVVPASFGAAVRLRELDLSENQLSGPVPGFSGFPELTRLILSHNRFEGEISAGLGYNPDLRTLHLDNNQLSGNIPREFGNLTILMDLRVNNNIGMTGTVPPVLINMRYLHTFWFDGTGLCTSTQEVFRVWLSYISDLRGTGCSVDTPPPSPPPPLPQVAEQDSLALVALYNSTDGPNWSRFNNWLVGPVYFWRGIGLVNRRVTEIILSSNALTGELPPEIGDLTELNTLILSGNFLRGGIPTAIDRLKNLEVLKLSSNQFSGEIPSVMRNLRKLRILALDNNLFSGTIPRMSSSIEEATLQDNLFSGSIGDYTWSADHVRVLNLERNELTGGIPVRVGLFSHLTSFKIGGNAGLTGTLPLSLANLKNVETFWFNDTDLCEPTYEGFQAWLTGISDLRRTGCTVDLPVEDITGACERSLGEAYLDINNVRARIPNTGGLFYRGEPHVYNVPRFTNSNAIFAGSLWIAGQVGGQIRAAATRYGPWEFWAGPIDDDGHPPIDCAPYDRVYKVSLTDIESYESTGEIKPDLLDWPTGLGAPTLDRNGDLLDILHLPLESRRYRKVDLEAGERPAIEGEQSIWWIMNDRGNVHGATRGPPLGVEVHGFAYAARSSIDAINDATLYKYRIINRNNRAIEDAYVGIHLDVDLGGAGDDYIGSDSLRGIGFVYNADNYDGGGDGYGTPPPALGIHLLEGPIGRDDGIDNDGDGAVDEFDERIGMSHFGTYYGGGGVTEDPENGSHYYTYLRGLWKDGEPFTVGGEGRSFSETPTNFFYSGDPVNGEFWSEVNIDGTGRRNPSGDRRFYISSGPFDLDPGEETDFTFAIVWARGEDHLASINAMKAAADEVKVVFDRGFTDIPAGIPPQESVTLVSPANGIDHQPIEPSLVWNSIEEAGRYQIELITTEGIDHFTSVAPTLQLDSLNVNQIHYWRVRVENVHGVGPWSELFHFTTGENSFSGLLGFNDFLVVQNFQGVLDPPEPAAANWRGFPVQGRPTDRQQVGEGRWLISTGMSSGCPSNCGDYSSFVRRSVRHGWSNIYPYDFEIRFTGTSLHYDRFGMVNGGIVTGDDLPFELWNIGINTPDDPGDDYRLIIAGFDRDGDGWGITGTDHDVSGGGNDPETDWFYWYNPTDTSPGTGGYDAWAAESLATDNGENVHLGPEILARMVYVNWNGGSVDEGSYDQRMPERGTIFRLTTPNELPVPLLAAPGYNGQKSPGNVSFYWAGVAYDVFRIQVANAADFSSVVLDSTDVFPGLEWPFTEAGQYYWRIQSTTGVWSNIWPFEIVGGATGISESDDLLPTEFNLFDNYPNPFSTSTVISYTLPEPAYVRLEVYDLIGRRVMVLIDQSEPPGRHDYQLIGTKLPSGTYFYILRAGTFSDTKMMIVVR